MGFGLPAAIGCKVGAPEKIVIDVDGDASFSMTAMELATAAQSNIGVKCMILNNGVQGMVYQWQGVFSLSFFNLCLIPSRSFLRFPVFAYTYAKSRFRETGRIHAYSCLACAR